MALDGFTVAGVSNALKYRFSPDALERQGYPRHPLVGIVPKQTDWTGSSMLHNIYHTGARGKGTTIALAQGNQSLAKVARFTIDREQLYAVHRLEREFMLASADQAGAMLKGRMAMMDDAVHSLFRDISRDLYGDGYGTLGRIGSVVDNGSTDTVTLSNPSDIVNFEVGMFIGCADTAGGEVHGAAADAYLPVIAVDRSNGTFTVTGDTGDEGWGTGDFLFEQGDGADSGATRKLMGLQGWIPATAPTSGDSFFGVDRSVEVTRLAGHRFTAVTDGLDPLQALIDAGTVMAREGASPEICLVNPVQRAQMAKLLHGQTVYNDVKSSRADVFYKALSVETGAGVVDVIMDPDCPVNKGFMLRKDALVLRSLKTAPHLVDDDGLTILRVSDSDSYEARWACYANLIVKKPNEICNITFAS